MVGRGEGWYQRDAVMVGMGVRWWECKSGGKDSRLVGL